MVSWDDCCDYSRDSLSVVISSLEIYVIFDNFKILSCFSI